MSLVNTPHAHRTGRYLLGFCALLVQMNVFSKIIIGFLPVGHTHEDIDQFFSRVAVYLATHNARSVEELGECIQQAYKKKGHVPTVVHWDAVANISEWLDHYLTEFEGPTSL